MGEFPNHPATVNIPCLKKSPNTSLSFVYLSFLTFGTWLALTSYAQSVKTTDQESAGVDGLSSLQAVPSSIIDGLNQFGFGQ